MPRVAVIGATGCVGRQICATFSAAGHDILAVARKAGVPHAAGLEFVELDVAATDAATIGVLFAERHVDVVVNAAGRWGPTRAEMVHSHLGVVQRLVEAVALMERAPRLVHIGSVHEYGPLPVGTSLDESAVPRPRTAYAQIKLACSTAVMALGGVVLRATNMYGPHPPEETFFAVLLLRLRAAMDTDEIVELSVADARRDFVDVRDVASAALAAASASLSGCAINIGSGRAADMRDLVTSFVAEARFPTERLRIAQREVPSHGGEWIQVDIRAARQLMDWRPRFTVQESLSAMWHAA
ncbi:NAD-dependent epimerase/dehydratase family protein [Micromonospora sp. NPDC048871]|uniref:NAD-dependent epimerase/dehydratase family protein n=1 Tax=unclassified Micromonospora TaxID=2617518 RepID=UPI002E0D4D84|nr:NAD(P)-dependent oxidoreductase [Micromonospora sp. NBC_01739]